MLLMLGALANMPCKKQWLANSRIELFLNGCSFVSALNKSIMKRHQLFSLLLLVTSLTLSSQSSFLKRRYTKGIFHEKIAKLKFPEAKDDKAATSKRLHAGAKNNAMAENNDEVFETKLVTETFVQTDPLSDALVLKETKGAFAKTDLKKEKVIAAKSPRKKTATVKKVQNPSDEDELVLTNTRLKQTTTSIGMSSTNTSVLSKASHSAGDESIWEYLFGNIWSVLLIILTTLVVLSLIPYAIVIFQLLALLLSPLALISLLSALVVGFGLYFLVKKYSEKHNGKGEKILKILELIGKGIYFILVGVIRAIAFIAT